MKQLFLAGVSQNALTAAPTAPSSPDNPTMEICRDGVARPTGARGRRRRAAHHDESTDSGGDDRSGRQRRRSARDDDDDGDDDGDAGDGSDPPDERWLPVGAVARRYSVVTRTVDRWALAGILPPATFFGGRRYWSESALRKCVREHVRKSRAPRGAA